MVTPRAVTWSGIKLRTGAVLLSVTVIVKVSESDRGGCPLSVTVTVTSASPSPCGSMTRTSVPSSCRSMAAVTMSSFADETVTMWVSPGSISVNMTGTDTVVLLEVAWSPIRRKTGASFAFNTVRVASVLAVRPPKSVAVTTRFRLPTS